MVQLVLFPFPTSRVPHRLIHSGGLWGSKYGPEVSARTTRLPLPSHTRPPTISTVYKFRTHTSGRHKHLESRGDTEDPMERETDDLKTPAVTVRQEVETVEE